MTISKALACVFRKKIVIYHHTDLPHDASARKHPLPIDTQLGSEIIQHYTFETFNKGK